MIQTIVAGMALAVLVGHLIRTELRLRKLERANGWRWGR